MNLWIRSQDRKIKKLKKYKKALITIEEVSNYLDDCSFEDVWYGIVKAMAFMVTLMLNIILFPIVIIRLLKSRR